MELGSEAWRCCGEQLLRGSELPALHPCPASSWGSSTGKRSHRKENLSRMSLAVVKARGVLSHPPAMDNRSLCPAPPHPLHLPLHLFQAKQALGFSSPSARLFPVLGQGFLKVITSSHELAVAGKVVPMLCQPLPQLLPDPAHPCSKACLHQLCFPVLSHPILEHHFGGPHPAQPLNWCRHLCR